MTMIMSVPRILGFDPDDVEMRAALAAGWKRRDLWWERLQEQANIALTEGRQASAIRRFHLAHGLARLGFSDGDPRRATGFANAAFAARLAGSEARAKHRYATARKLWAKAPTRLESLQLRPRARSSLFHLRMEVRHWETYRDNMKTRLGKFIQETDMSLATLARNEPPPHRLFSRWRGEKPSVFDDTRKLLAASLLVASDAG